MNRTRIALQLILLAAVPLTAGGCASLSLATIGTALGAVGSAASSGSSVYHLGKLDDVFMASYEQARVAVALAADDMHLEVIEDRQKSPKHDDQWVFVIEDDLHSKITVTVQKRTVELVRCRVDVGFFGSQPTSELLMDRIRLHLPRAARETGTVQPTTQASTQPAA